MARHLRTKNIPFTFQYSNFSCDVPGYEKNVTYRHIWVDGFVFGVYITYTNDSSYYQVFTGYDELNFDFYPNKQNYERLDFVLELRNDGNKLEKYLLQLKENKKNADNLLEEYKQEKSYEEKVD